MNVLWSLNLEVGVSYLHGHDRTLAVSGDPFDPPKWTETANLAAH